MKCTWCLWAIESFGEIVGCVACDDECPTNEDIEAAKKGGYLAYNGCSCESDEKYLVDMLQISTSC